MLLSLLDQVFYNEVAMYLIGKKKKKKIEKVYLYWWIEIEITSLENN